MSVKYRLSRFTRRLWPPALALLCTFPASTVLASKGQPLRWVNEYGALRMRHSEGATVDEEGTGSGTFSCTVSIDMTLSGTLVTASYLAHPNGGSIRGTARAHIHSATTREAHFSGTITLDGGTGSYAHASGTASFDGTINRTTYAMSIHIVGRLHL